MEQMKLLKMKKRLSSIKILLDYIYSKLGSSKGKITKLVTIAIKQSKIMHSEKINDWTSITKKLLKNRTSVILGTISNNLTFVQLET